VTGLDLAKARATLAIQLAGGKSSRVAARSLSEDQRREINDPEAAAMVLYSSDSPTRDQARLLAASILNANDIAASVSSEDRLELSKLIDDNTRRIALQSRAMARPSTGAKGADCATNIRACVSDMGAVFADLSPFETVDAALPDDIARLRPIAKAALDQVSITDG